MSAPLRAAEFHPELLFDQTYNSNLLTRVEAEETSDLVTRLSVALPVLHEWETGHLSFRYEPSYEWYRDNDSLNHDENRAELGVLAEPGPRSSIDYHAAYRRTQDQGTIRDTPLGGTVLVPRSERELLETGLRFERDISPRMAWNGTLEAARIEHTLLEDPGADPTTRGLEDRSEYGGSLGLDRAVSRRDRLGVRALYDRYDLETSGKEKVAQLALRWERFVPGKFDAALLVGGFRRDSELGLSGTPSDSTDESGLSLGLELARVFRRSRLGLAASRGPSAGGSIEGTSTDTVARLFWTGSPGPRWIWTLDSVYTLREPTLAEIPEFRTYGGGGRLEWRPLPVVGFRLEAERVERTGDDPALDASVTLATFGLVWYPRGPERPAGEER